MSPHPAFIFGVLTSFLLATQVNHVSCGSCKESKLCCPGRDSSCVVQKTPINAIIEDLSDKPCYCDHACLKLGDCCPDFKDACGGKCLIRVSKRHYFEGLERKWPWPVSRCYSPAEAYGTTKTLRIVSVSAVIRTRYFPKCYRS
jgi:hypothetical protein